MLLQGYTKEDVLEYLTDDCGYTPKTSERYFFEAQKRATENLQEFMDQAKKVAISKILSISDKAYKDNKLNDSLKALDMLNKIFSNYAPEKVDVTTDQPIEIKLD